MKTKINNWLSFKVEPRESDTHGRGVFVVEEINKDEIVAVFGGHVMTRDEVVSLPEEVGRLNLGIDDDLFIGPKSLTESDDADWINHSCDPNCGIWGQIMLVATRPIHIGEEITFDYCMTCSQKGEKRVLFSCKCGAKNCRGEVTNQDWKIKELQEKYKGYFSFFVQRNIDQLEKLI